jgi:hypothetical protein
MKKEAESRWEEEREKKRLTSKHFQRRSLIVHSGEDFTKGNRERGALDMLLQSLGKLRLNCLPEKWHEDVLKKSKI